jgi:hypothetical protein
MMLDAVADESVNWGYFDSRKSPWSEIHPATWADLVRKGLVTGMRDIYKLTGGGWLEALCMTERIGERPFRDRLGKFLGYLKDHVKGRKQDALVDLHKLPS